MNNKQRLNVQIIAPISPYKEFGGGIVTSVTNIVKQLNQNIDFRLIGVTFEDGKKCKNKFPEIEFFSAATLKLKHIGNNSSIIFALGIFKHKKKIDKPKSIFHVQRVDSAFPLLYPVKNKNPLIVHIRGSNTYWKYLDKSIYFRKLMSLVEYLVIKRADKIIMVSKKGLKEYHNIYPKYREKIIYIPNGVNINKFYPIENRNQIRREFNIPEDRKIILYTGRLVKEKGIDLLLKSFEMINERVTNFMFLFIGDGPLKSNIAKIGEKYKNIELISPVSNDKMPKIYNIANVLVMASYFEGWSNTLGEALACGVPVVTTNVGDAEELIRNGENGYVVNDQNPQNYAEKCILAMEHSERMRNYARESIMPYSLENMASQIERIYRSVLL